MSHNSLPPRERGQGLVEYALILVLVSVAVIAIMIFLGGSVGGVFEEVTTNLSGQTIEGVGTEYIIGGFSVTTTGGPSECTVSISDVNVTRYDNGERAAAGQNVTVSVTISGGPGTGGSGTTDANGVAVISIPNTNGNNCPGSGSVTISGGGNSRTVNY